MCAASPVIQHYIPGALVARWQQLFQPLVAAQEFSYAVAEGEHGFADIRRGREAEEGQSAAAAPAQERRADKARQIRRPNNLEEFFGCRKGLNAVVSLCAGLKEFGVLQVAAFACEAMLRGISEGELGLVWRGACGVGWRKDGDKRERI